MSLIPFFGLLLCIVGALTATTTPSPGSVDIKSAARNLVKGVRDLSVKAKNGMVMSDLLQEMLALQNETSRVIQQLTDNISECETSLVIKMAAAGTGSHEVLTLLLADDSLSVLNGRLSLSLAVLENVAQQLEDELALSNDIGPQLSALVFGTNATATIAKTADVVVNEVVSLAKENIKDARRFLEPLRLGGGWTAGLGGVSWTSSNGRTSFNVAPTLSGVSAGLTFRF